MTLLKIANGRIYDPVQGMDGTVGDLWIRDGVVCRPEPDARADRVIDAAGMIVMPGGIDIHCHIAGSKVNAARKLQVPDESQVWPGHGDFRAGTQGLVPSTFTTGYLYAGLGYTTAFDAAIPPLSARQVHDEFHDIPILDKGCFVMLGNNDYLLRQLAQNETELFRNSVAWLVNAVKAYGVKVVNPGGVQVWKQSGGNVRHLDDVVPEFGVTPRQIVSGMAQAVDDLQLPHPLHLHCTNLGMPGNASTTLETMQALDGHRAHLAHVQFHSYGGDPDDQTTFHSRVPELVDFVMSQPGLSVDVGQVLFGPAIAMTGDSPLGYYLQKVLGAGWYSCDVELEAGCGIVPITYQRKSLVHALQWAIGLEWYLLMPDPWRIAMSTDHPNGASFLAYPQILALLMDANRRQEALKSLPPEVRNRCTLGELTREYTLSEVAILTRAAPARMLGLKQKGHLGPGADGDVTIYQPETDLQRMFELPRYVISAGQIIVDDAELKRSAPGHTLYAVPEFDAESGTRFERFIDENYSLRAVHYGVNLDELSHGVAVTGDLGD